MQSRNSLHYRALLPVVLFCLPILGTAASGQVINEDLKLAPKDASEQDVFGIRVAVSGRAAIIGASGCDDYGFRSGAAYLFDKDSGRQFAKLHSSDIAEGDHFGIGIAIGRTTAIIGAFQDDDHGANSGSAYLFDSHTGQQVAKLLASDGDAGDKFGAAVAISGDVVVVGASRHDANGRDSGIAYVFDAVSGAELARLVPDDGEIGDRFGYSVAVCGSIAIIGADGDDDNGLESGSAYLFDVTTGEQLAKLLPEDGAEEDYFGWSVAISESTALVGAVGQGNDSGSVYLFEVATGQQIAQVFASDADSGDRFGISLASDGPIAVIGAFRDDDHNHGVDSGSAYLFDVSDPRRARQIAKLLASDGAKDDLFGLSVAISESTVIVGAPYRDQSGEDSGSAYVYYIDDLVPACLELDVADFAANQTATWTVSNVTPGGRAAIVYGFQEGNTNVTGYSGYCASLGIKGVRPSRLIGQAIANANGEAKVTKRVPAGTSGMRVLMQAAERGTCPDECVSNLLDEVIG